MSRIIALIYGALCYVFFFVTFLYALAFVENAYVPRTIDAGPSAPLTEALIVNLVLMSLFAIQHSVMARPQFKAWWTQFVPKTVERSTYVLFATAALALLCWQWRPIPMEVWHVSTRQRPISWLPVAPRLGDRADEHLHDQPFRVVRVYQVAKNFTGSALPDAKFKTPLLYNFVRHPIYLGFIIAFWAAPVMTVVTCCLRR